MYVNGQNYCDRCGKQAYHYERHAKAYWLKLAPMFGDDEFSFTQGKTEDLYHATLCVGCHDELVLALRQTLEGFHTPHERLPL